MHRSRLSTFVLDCKVPDLERAADFWSRALGRRWTPEPDGDPNYRRLDSDGDEPLLLVQKVEHDSRIHLDIETDGDTNYRLIDSDAEEPLLLLQRVEHDSRIHLDIEADDLEAEARRLEALGARRIAFIRRWIVMEAPTGQRFCVVNPQRGALAGQKRTTEWP